MNYPEDCRTSREESHHSVGKLMGSPRSRADFPRDPEELRRHHRGARDIIGCVMPRTNEQLASSFDRFPSGIHSRRSAGRSMLRNYAVMTRKCRPVRPPLARSLGGSVRFVFSPRFLPCFHPSAARPLARLFVCASVPPFSFNHRDRFPVFSTLVPARSVFPCFAHSLRRGSGNAPKGTFTAAAAAATAVASACLPLRGRGGRRRRHRWKRGWLAGWSVGQASKQHRSSDWMHLQANHSLDSSPSLYRGGRNFMTAGRRGRHRRYFREHMG